MRAFTVREDNGEIQLGVTDSETEAPGDVVIDVAFSSLNFKDAMVARVNSPVRRTPELIMGVEASGRVRSSETNEIPVGATVIAYGDAIGVGRDGGFAETLRVPARFVTVLNEPALDARRAMIYGLAGYTAMASVLALEAYGTTPGDGEVLVTGATGGVGSLAVALLARRGFRVVASTGSAQHRDWLLSLGAAAIIGRDEIADRPGRILGTERWAGAVDCVGGETLAETLRSLRYGAAVAASGLVASASLTTTVYPFITRNVALLGIDSVETTPAARQRVWNEIASVASDDDERLVERVIDLEEIPEGLATIERGATRGRWLVRPRSVMNTRD